MVGKPNITTIWFYTVQRNQRAVWSRTNLFVFVSNPMRLATLRLTLSSTLNLIRWNVYCSVRCVCVISTLNTGSHGDNNVDTRV